MSNKKAIDFVPVDICVITHNRDETLLRCIKNVLSCSVLPSKIIIVHSQPANKCRHKEKIEQICNQLGVKLDYVNVEHRGVSYSRNIAIKHCENLFFGFIDDDEYPSKLWIEYAFRFLATNKKISAVSGPKIPTDMSNYWRKLWFELYKNSLNKITKTTFITSSNSFYRTSFIKKNKITYDNDFKNSSEDFVFSYLMMKNGAKLVFNKNVVVYHDFRSSFASFILQWHGYGNSAMFFFHKYLNKSGLNMLKQALLTAKCHKEINIFNIKLWPGLMVADFSFIVGAIRFYLFRLK